MFAGILIVILVVAFMFLFVDEYFNYAKVEYYLSGSTYVDSGGVLQINLYLYNAGDVNVIPTLTVRVVNATIQNIVIPSISAANLLNYCSYNKTFALIENITASAKVNSSLWATIYVVPVNGISSFSIFSNATVPFDILHIRNILISNLPTTVSYSLSGSNVFMRSIG